ncbi:hypothetical protein [Croceimicrobium hydrocarbonivorans]|uniref:Uncharacterized protein n=1 Tax=Croceimicrobium hydrocarbonivorans TaxID=2761580 RepID=A0A7H0VCH0_9FLAO|nr:hypothetical protein [Croceimicrobium hydrocarbonivorans]QNR23418.1 hypothetical protein H4K34_13670 [Croceimicrobium hydrocarbonivorans]
MNSTTSTLIKIGLFLLIVFLGYRLYSIILDPINYEKLKERRYTAVKSKLEQIRDIQKAYRTEYSEFAADLNAVIAFVDTGKIARVERKDSTFMYYNETYQQEMEKDTIVKKILGYESVKLKLFNADFDPESLRYIPFSNNKEFDLKAGKLEVNDVVVPVFEAKASNTAIFHDVLNKYGQYIDEEYALQVGDMNEPTLSGNWR